MTRGARILTALLSHWRRHPGQFATLMLGLAMATALWSGVQALNWQARQSYDRAAALLGDSELAALVPAAAETVDQDLFVALRRAGWPVSPVIEGRVRVSGASYRLIGIDPVSLPEAAGLREIVTSPGSEADPMAFFRPPGQTILGPETRSELGLAEGARPMTDRGRRLPPLSVRAGAAPGILITDIGFAQNILGRAGRISRLLIGAGGSPDRPPITEVVGDTLQRVPPAPESDLDRLTESFHLNLTAFGFLAFVVGLFIVHGAIGLAVEQRRTTMRTLRACGVSVRALTAVALAELALLAIAAGLAGTLLGYGFAAALLPDVAASLRGLYGARVAGELSLAPGWWLASIAMSLLGALIAGAHALYQVRCLPALETGRAQAWHDAQARWLRLQTVIGIGAIAAAGALLILADGLGAAFAVMAGLLLGSALALPAVLAHLLRLGHRFARGPVAEWFWADCRQQLSGLSLALMALLLALATNIGVGTMVESFRLTFTQWLEGRLAAEIYLSAPDDATADRIVDWLEDRPEVDGVLPVPDIEGRIEGLPVSVHGLADHATYRTRWPLLAALPDVWDRLARGDAALISEQLARRLDLDLGDTLAVPTPSGPWTVTIAGIHADYGNPKGQIRVGLNAFRSHWPKSPRTDYTLRVPPETVNDIAAALRQRFPGLSLRDQATLKSDAQRIFGRTFAVTAALNALTLGVAGVALLTSLLTLANRRLAQLAPLWALGLTRRRLARIELVRLAALALIVGALAVPLGVALAWLLTHHVNPAAFGWHLPLHHFPGDWMRMIALALLTAILAAVWPALRLRRIPPARLLRIFADER